VVDPLKLAIVGVGRMGALHARALAKVPEIELVAVVDARPEAVRTVADDTGAEAMASPNALVIRSDVEAWVVATPTPTHPQLVGMALDAGVHVLCEKPLSLVSSDGQLLANQANAGGRILQVGFWRRFSPPWAKAKELVDGGAIGRPILIRFAQWDANPPPPAFCDPAVSGGLAIDCGVHEYDLAEWLTGSRVEYVVARNLPIVDQAVGESGDVDNLIALLDLTGGASAVVDLTRNARYGDDVRTEILGSDGALFVETLPLGRARLATSTGVSVVPGSEVEDAMTAGIIAQAQAFAAAVRGVTVDLPGAEASDRSLAIGRAVQESASRGEGVPVLPHAASPKRLTAQPGDKVRI